MKLMTLLAGCVAISGLAVDLAAQDALMRRARSQPQDLVTALQVGGKFIAMGAPQLVAAGQISEMAMSQDGRFVAVVVRETSGRLEDVLALLTTPQGQPRPGVAQVRLVDTSSKTSKTLVEFNPVQEQVESLAFIGASPNLVFVRRAMEMSPDGPVQKEAFCRADARTGTMEVLRRVEGLGNSISTGMNRRVTHDNEEYDVPVYVRAFVRGRFDSDIVQLFVLPGAPVAVLLEQRVVGAAPPEGRNVAPVSASYTISGTVAHLIPPSGPMRAVPIDRQMTQPAVVEWTPEPHRPLLSYLMSPPGGGASRRETVEIEPGSGAVLNYAGPAVPSGTAVAKDGPLRVVMAPNPVRFQDEPAPLVAAWLQSRGDQRFHSALIASSAFRAELSPTGQAVFYVSAEGAFMRPFVEIPAEALAAIERTEILSQAKQVGTALHIYAADNGDKFPPDGSDLSVLDPYLRNRAVREGFVYTYRGPRELTQLQNPSQTEVGYIEGPGGRAVVYADSSVRWRPNN
ncbi:MAG: hypothetical protein ACK4XJ_04880 [Fimbriimonadaceae bacterium]